MSYEVQGVVEEETNGSNKGIEDIIFEVMKEQLKNDENWEIIKPILNIVYEEAKTFNNIRSFTKSKKEELKLKALYGLNVLITKNTQLNPSARKKIILKVTEIFYNMYKDKNNLLTELQKKAIIRQIYLSEELLAIISLEQLDLDPDNHLITRKNDGRQFGIKIKQKDKQNDAQITKYFIKGYQNYPVSSTNTMMSYTGGNHRINLAELMVYKILEKLKVGPKTTFIINPFLQDGIYIATENLGLNELFETGSTLNENVKAKRSKSFDDLLKSIIERNGTNKEADNYSIAEISLNRIDILGRILNLSDQNEGNFGCTSRKSENEDWKILDFDCSFWPNEENDDIDLFKRKLRVFEIDGFLVGNDMFNYRMDGILHKVLTKKLKEDKINIANIVLQQFEEKDFKKIIEVSYNELINFLSDEKCKTLIIPENDKKILGAYKDKVLENYEIFKKTIKEELTQDVFSPPPTENARGQ